LGESRAVKRGRLRDDVGAVEGDAGEYFVKAAVRPAPPRPRWSVARRLLHWAVWAGLVVWYVGDLVLTVLSRVRGHSWDSPEDCHVVTRDSWCLDPKTSTWTYAWILAPALLLWLWWSWVLRRADRGWFSRLLVAIGEWFRPSRFP